MSKTVFVKNKKKQDTVLFGILAFYAFVYFFLLIRFFAFFCSFFSLLFYAYSFLCSFMLCYAPEKSTFMAIFYRIYYAILALFYIHADYLYLCSLVGFAD